MLRATRLLCYGYLALSPLYVLPSGVPQPADILMAGAIFMSIVRKDIGSGAYKYSNVEKRLSIYLFLFVGYTWVITLLWAIYESNPNLVRFPLYYTYDALVFLTFIVVYKESGKKFLKIIFYVISIASICILSYHLIINRSGAVIRPSITFNNPNQLGYYSLLVSTILLLIWNTKNVSTIVMVAAQAANFLLASISLSVSAIIGLIFLYLIYVFSVNIKNAMIVISSLLVLMAIYGGGSGVGNRVINRLESGYYNLSQELSIRGYDRLFILDEYIIFGAAEGSASGRSFANQVEKNSIHSKEVHSSFGVLIICYGVVGFMIFMLFLRELLSVYGVKGSVLLVPILMYGTAHQGLRFTHLWILLAIMVCILYYRNGSETASTRSRKYSTP
ncbi:hypothetical protein GGP94_001845 [Salinibacter ruber]|nr:hypothetical protein [Salinibacter ruber]